MTQPGLRAATTALLAAAVLGTTGCATHRHWMTAAPAPAPASPTASGTTTLPTSAPPTPPTTGAAAVTVTDSASPPTASPTSAPASQTQPPAKGSDSVPAPHRHHQHHSRRPSSTDTPHHPGGARPAGRHAGSPCDALAHEGGLPGNLYAQCHQLYG